MAKKLQRKNKPAPAEKEEKEKKADKQRRISLLDLPTELVEHILAFAYAKRPPSGPICKALLPSHRALVFAKVKVRSLWSLSNLLSKLEQEPFIASRVKSFRVTGLECRQQSSEEEKDKTVETFGKLLSKLPNLTHLGVEKSDELLRLIVAKNMLNDLPSIESVYLDWPWSWPRFNRGAAVSLPALRLPHIRSLTIADPTNTPVLSSLLQSTDKLEHLSLVNMPYTLNPRSLLDQLPEPVLLKDLALDGDGRVPFSLQLIETKMQEFVSLRHLKLADSIVFLEPSFLAALQPLPLEHLTLGPDLSVESQAVLSALEGDDSLPHLKHLTLDMFSAVRGLSVEDCLSDPWSFDDTWSMPIYPPNLPRNSIEELIDEARNAGLVVDGTVVEALDIEREYEEQREELKMHLRKFGSKRDAQGWLSESDDE